MNIESAITNSNEGNICFEQGKKDERQRIAEVLFLNILRKYCIYKVMSVSVDLKYILKFKHFYVIENQFHEWLHKI